MEKIRWKNSLSVGIELIDNQHKQWIEHYNNIVESLTSQQDRAQISKTLGYRGASFVGRKVHDGKQICRITGT
jgi:hypothetical protein